MFQTEINNQRHDCMLRRKQLTEDERQFAAIERKVKQIRSRKVKQLGRSSKPGRGHNSHGCIACPKQYTEAQRQLAAIARKAATNRDVLYHGTRYPQSILTTGVLLAQDEGKISFTRSAEEAAYWALLPRAGGDEGRGSILIFDRQSLRCRYKIKPCHDPIWDDKARYNDEAEEGVWADVINVGKYLIGLVSEDSNKSSDLGKTKDAQWRREIEIRLNELLYFVPDWRCRPEEYLRR